MGEDNPAIAGLQIYHQLLTAIESEVRSFRLAVQLDDEGAVLLQSVVDVKDNGQLAPVLLAIKPAEHNLLAGLPNIPYVFAGGGVMPKGAAEATMDFSGAMMKAMNQVYQLEPEQVDAMMDLATKYFGDMQGMSFVLGVGEDDAPLYNSMLMTIQVPDSQKYLDDYRDYWRQLQEVISDSESPLLKDAELAELTLDGQLMLKLTMPMPKLNSTIAADQAEMDSMMDKLFWIDGNHHLHRRCRQAHRLGRLYKRRDAPQGLGRQQGSNP